jgi:hypothetical protein
VTTLGATLASALNVLHLDADTVFWLPTDPPFTTQRGHEERLAMTRAILSPVGSWVFSGSAVSWAAAIEPWFELIVFLTLDPIVRMARLRQREIARFGDRLAPGGDMAEEHAAFLCWASAYDTAGDEQRSRMSHETWLAAQRVPVLRLDSIVPTTELVRAILQALGLGEGLAPLPWQPDEPTRHKEFGRMQC